MIDPNSEFAPALVAPWHAGLRITPVSAEPGVRETNSRRGDWREWAVVEDIRVTRGPWPDYRAAWKVNKWSATCEVYRAICSSDPGAPDDQFDIEFPRKGRECGHETVGTLDEAQAAIGAFIKWDGCTEFRQKDFPWHHCGAEPVRGVARLVEYLYRRAMDLMGRGGRDASDPWEDLP